jgi:2-isopropylmalate synthase
MNVDVYDTTLRDGTQREGLSLSLDDKLRIAHRLDALGVAFIEAGWPGSNPKDAETFARMRGQRWRAALAAFGSTRRAGVRPADDPGLVSLVDAGTPVVTIFGKTSTLHVDEVLRVTRTENLAMIEDSVAWLRAAGRRVIYDAEHFFDGLARDRAYALATLEAAARGGAEVLVLCDTNGGSLPSWIAEGVAAAARLGRPVGIHAHDDGGLAVANSLAAVGAGATHVQGTINGYGERCGNANLCAVVPNLELKLGRRCIPALAELTEVATFVAEVANLMPNDHQPYVGRSAFAHKGGVHVAAMRRCADSYQHIDPALVGNQTRVVVSELSGRGNLASKAEELGLAPDDGAVAAIKEAEARGFAYEAADASVALLLVRRRPGYAPPFERLGYQVLATASGCDALVKLRVGGRLCHTAAEGAGPVEALDKALRKALPEADGIVLCDYKVRIVDGRAGTAAVTRVLVSATDGARTWTTVGASPSILEASWQALADAIEFGISQKGEVDESGNRSLAR